MSTVNCQKSKRYVVHTTQHKQHDVQPLTTSFGFHFNFHVSTDYFSQVLGMNYQSYYFIVLLNTFITIFRAFFQVDLKKNWH